jgi:hypothetical protein
MPPADTATRKQKAKGSCAVTATAPRRAASRAASWWLPSLDVYAEYALYTLRDRDSLLRRDRDDFATGVRLTWTFFDTAAMTDSRASNFERAATREDAKQKYRDFSAQVKSTQEEMIHLHELVHNSEERVKQGSDYLSSTRGDYDRGVKNSPDVIAAIEKQISFQKEFLDRKLAYQKARDRLLALTQNVND